MAGTPSNSAQRPQTGIVHISKLALLVLGFLWTLILLPLAINALSTVISLPQDWQTSLKKIFDWAFHNPGYIVLGLIILALLTCISYLLSRSRPAAVADGPPNPFSVTINNIPPAPVAQPAHQPPPDSELAARYSQRMLRSTERLNLTGIPAWLVAPSVPLDDVFIPVQFYPKRLSSDYPLTKEEFANHHKLLQQGIFSEEMERVFIGSEKSWETLLRQGDKITLADLWQQLDRNNPAAVIQGYPGMGKSTLMAHLTLHMARRGLGLPDPTMDQTLALSQPSSSSLIPILLPLKDYATELKKAVNASADLPLVDYLKIATERLHIPDLFPFLQNCLAQGHCLVMLDGLDEVSDLAERKLVKQAIENFILENRDTSKRNFNRFLITSRVAGYDVVAFASYSHYTIADLTFEQIDDFLPRWCRASVRPGSIPAAGINGEKEEMLLREAEQMAQKLSTAIHTHQGQMRR